MKQQWRWLLAGWVMVAGLAGCAQVAVPFGAETAPETASAASPDLVVATANPITEPTAAEANLTEEPTPAGTQTPGRQAESVPITTTQISQEEVVTIENTPVPTPSDPGLQALVRQAREDLATRLGIDVDQIKTLEVRQVVWPDTSLGCPEEGIAYQTGCG